jgi:C-terminal processing protease CtpA/Prc
MDVDVAAEMTQLFDEAWRKMRDGFYDPKMHGCDWDGVRARYRPVVHNLTYKEDFYALFNLALGELNASHTGISGPREVEAVATASLGVAFDDGFPGPGLKVRSVMAKGPADRDRSRLRPGDVILQIDGVEPASNEDAFRLLTGRAGKRVELILGAGSGAAKGEGKSGQSATVVIRAITPAACRQLEYERWVKEREGLVDRLSARRLAYVHLAGMGAANLEAFRRMALGDAEQKRGLVLDLRFNGGGSVADEMFSILNNRVFGYRLIRGDEGFVPAPMPAFTRPVIVLANEASFSNAEVFPWGFRALKLGKIVGVPTFGGVIGTGGTNLIDGSSLRMPAVGSYTIDCANMENNGCPPDILVEHTLDDIQAKHDRQLEIAVAELLTTVGRQRQVVPRSLPDQGARRPRPRGRAR